MHSLITTLVALVLCTVLPVQAPSTPPSFVPFTDAIDYDFFWEDDGFYIPEGEVIVLDFDSSSVPEYITSGDYVYFVNEDGTATVHTYNGREAHLTIPAALDGHAVTALDERSCCLIPLESLVLPEGLKTVGTSAFFGCSLLTEVELPDSLTEIGAAAFYLCSSLQSIELPAGLTAIDSHAFCQSGLKSVALPDGLQRLESGAFANCEALTSVAFPASGLILDGNPFPFCPNLRTIDIAPDHPTLTAEGGLLIDKRSGTLLSVLPDLVTADFRVPDGVRAIGASVFSENAALQSVTLPDGLTEIGEYAFSYCEALRSVVLPDSLTKIDACAFQFSDLQELQLPANLTEIGDMAFFACAGLTAVEIPAGVRSVGEYAFSRCTALETVSLPADAKYQNGVFCNCQALTTVTLPDGLEAIPDVMFAGCTALKSVSVPASVVTIGNVAFSACSKLTLIVSPGSCAEAYARENQLPCQYSDE